MKRFGVLFLLGTFVLIFLVLILVYREPHRQAIDPQSPLLTTNTFIRTPQGDVHYEEDGRNVHGTIIMVGGAGLGYSVWDENFRYFVGRGYRVIRYDHFGRGHSDRLPEYSLEVYRDQLIHLTDKLGIQGPVHLVAHSFGAMVVLSTLEKVRVRSIVMISPAGFSPFRPRALFRYPIVSDIAIELAWMPMALDKQMQDLKKPEKYPEFRSKLKNEISLKGFKFAQKALWRDILPRDMTSHLRIVENNNIPLLVILGREDNRVSPTTGDKINREVDHCSIHILDSVSHHAMYESPKEVNELILDFLP